MWMLSYISGFQSWVVHACRPFCRKYFLQILLPEFIQDFLWMNACRTEFIFFTSLLQNYTLPLQFNVFFFLQKDLHACQSLLWNPLLTPCEKLVWCQLTQEAGPLQCGPRTQKKVSRVSWDLCNGLLQLGGWILLKVKKIDNFSACQTTSFLGNAVFSYVQLIDFWNPTS